MHHVLIDRPPSVASRDVRVHHKVDIVVDELIFPLFGVEQVRPKTAAVAKAACACECCTSAKAERRHRAACSDSETRLQCALHIRNIRLILAALARPRTGTVNSTQLVVRWSDNPVTAYLPSRVTLGKSPGTVLKTIKGAHGPTWAHLGFAPCLRASVPADPGAGSFCPPVASGPDLPPFSSFRTARALLITCPG